MSMAKLKHEYRTIILKVTKENDFNNFRVDGKSTDDDRNFKSAAKVLVIAAFIDQVEKNYQNGM